MEIHLTKSTESHITQYSNGAEIFLSFPTWREEIEVDSDRYHVEKVGRTKVDDGKFWNGSA